MSCPGTASWRHLLPLLSLVPCCCALWSQICDSNSSSTDGNRCFSSNPFLEFPHLSIYSVAEGSTLYFTASFTLRNGFQTIPYASVFQFSYESARLGVNATSWHDACPQCSTADLFYACHSLPIALLSNGTDSGAGIDAIVLSILFDPVLATEANVGRDGERHRLDLDSDGNIASGADWTQLRPSTLSEQCDDLDLTGVECSRNLLDNQMVSIGSTSYFVAGSDIIAVDYDEETYTASCELMANNVCRDATACPQSRTSDALHAKRERVHDNIVVLEGTSAAEGGASLWLFDTSSKSWSSLCARNSTECGAIVPSSRSNFATALVDGIFYLYGGRGFDVLNDLWAIDVLAAERKWMLVCGTDIEAYHVPNGSIVDTGLPVEESLFAGCDGVTHRLLFGPDLPLILQPLEVPDSDEKVLIMFDAQSTYQFEHEAVLALFAEARSTLPPSPVSTTMPLEPGTTPVAAAGGLSTGTVAGVAIACVAGASVIGRALYRRKYVKPKKKKYKPEEKKQQHTEHGGHSAIRLEAPLPLGAARGAALNSIVFLGRDEREHELSESRSPLDGVVSPGNDERERRRSGSSSQSPSRSWSSSQVSTPSSAEGEGGTACRDEREREITGSSSQSTSRSQSRSSWSSSQMSTPSSPEGAGTASASGEGGATNNVVSVGRDEHKREVSGSSSQSPSRSRSRSRSSWASPQLSMPSSNEGGGGTASGEEGKTNNAVFFGRDEHENEQSESRSSIHVAAPRPSSSAQSRSQSSRSQVPRSQAPRSQAPRSQAPMLSPPREGANADGSAPREGATADASVPREVEAIADASALPEEEAIADGSAPPREGAIADASAPSEGGATADRSRRAVQVGASINGGLDSAHDNVDMAQSTTLSVAARLGVARSRLKKRFGRFALRGRRRSSQDAALAVQSPPPGPAPAVQSPPPDAAPAVLSPPPDAAPADQTSVNAASTRQIPPPDRDAASISQSPPPDAASISQSLPRDRDATSVSQSQPRNAASISQSPPRDATSISQSPPRDRDAASISQSPPRDATSAVHRSPRDEASAIPQSPPRDAASISQSPPRDEASAIPGQAFDAAAAPIRDTLPVEGNMRYNPSSDGLPSPQDRHSPDGSSPLQGRRSSDTASQPGDVSHGSSYSKRDALKVKKRKPGFDNLQARRNDPSGLPKPGFRCSCKSMFRSFKELMAHQSVCEFNNPGAAAPAPAPAPAQDRHIDDDMSGSDIYRT